MKKIPVTLIIGILFGFIMECKPFSTSVEPEIVISPSDGGVMNVQLGQNVKLTCTVFGAANADVMWKRFPAVFGTSSLSQSRSPSSAVYEISSISENDKGIYMCVASNLPGIIQKAVRLIIANVNPDWRPTIKVTIAPDHSRHVIGERVELNCKVEAPHDLKIHLQWQRLIGSSLQSGIIVNNGLLTIPRVTKMDAGGYTCLALGQDGTQLNRSTSYLQVISPPIIKLIRSIKTVDATPSIHCIGIADGPVTIKWTAIGRKVLPPNVQDDNGVLKFQGTAGRHAGEYLCSATNEAKSVSKVVQVSFGSQECN